MFANLLVTLLACSAGELPRDVVVVCPAEFREAFEPWLAHRRAQGHRISLLPNLPPDTIRQRVRQAAQGGALGYLVLVGDADARLFDDADVRRRSVQTHYTRAEVNVRFGSSPEIATDNWYADLDDDRVPEIAVGRLSCDTAAELRVMVAKILDYERSVDFGAWRRNVHFVAGLGGFGPLADTVLEAAAKSLIGNGIPAAYATTMTYGSWQSPYCPDPRDFRRVTLGRLNEGSLFWVYIGHGQQRAVDEVIVPGGRYPILSADDARQLECRHGAPIACLLACYSGAYDLPRDCLAEEMLASPGGPVAVLCGSRVTMPYGMTVLGSELLAQCFGDEPLTLGAALVAAKQNTMESEQTGPYRAALDAVARVISPTADHLEAERAEHLDLFNLLGDPLLRVGYPRRVEVNVAQAIQAGRTIRVALDSPLAGRGVVELAVERGRLTFKPPRRAEYDVAALAGYAAVYEQANEARLVSREFECRAGTFATTLEVPPEARGKCHVRVFLAGAEGCAAGAAEILVEALPERSAKRESQAATR